MEAKNKEDMESGLSELEFHIRECPVEGSQEPSAKKVLLKAAIPKKCVNCRFRREDHCKKVTNRLLRFDYGDCGIEGSKELVEHPDAVRRIPLKCASCVFLEIHRFYGVTCGKDKEVWGDIPRGLDY